MPETPPEAMVVYSDYVCPFCYLGKASLERYEEQAEDPPQVQWRPFDLRAHKRREDGTIDHDVQDGKDEAYFQRVRENVDRLKEEYGAEMTWDLPRDIDSWKAHKLALHVEQEHDAAAFQALHDAIFEALWTEGRDIGDEEVLVELAGKAGVDADEVRQALADEALEAQLRERMRQSQRQGITGVPTFAYGGLALPGAVPPEHLGKLVENG